MLFVFNKDKIVSCLIATSIVIVLFIMSASVIPSSNTKIMQVSSNVTNSIVNENCVNNIYDTNIK